MEEWEPAQARAGFNYFKAGLVDFVERHAEAAAAKGYARCGIKDGNGIRGVEGVTCQYNADYTSIAVYTDTDFNSNTHGNTWRWGWQQPSDSPGSTHGGCPFACTDSCTATDDASSQQHDADGLKKVLQLGYEVLLNDRLDKISGVVTYRTQTSTGTNGYMECTKPTGEHWKWKPHVEFNDDGQAMYHTRDKYWRRALSDGGESCRDPDLESGLVAQVQKARDAYCGAMEKDMEIPYTYATEVKCLPKSLGRAGITVRTGPPSRRHVP